MVKYFFIFIFFTSILYSQVDTLINRNDIENLLEDSSIDNEESYNYDVLEYLSQNPILINNASVKDLLQIPFLNLTTAKAIIRHRNLLGGIYDVDQLRFVAGVSFETIEKILPFIKLGDEQPLEFREIFQEALSDFKVNIRTRGIYDLQPKYGFTSSKFPNSRIKTYNRFLSEYSNKFRIGVLFEKDPGEKKINDFTTFHIQLKNMEYIKNLVIGDFNFEFGQGLAFWSRYAFSKGTEAVEVLPRNSRGLIPYLSTDENQFLRGISLVSEHNNFTFSTFFSSKFLDASVDSTTNLITSLRIDGLHRTQNEINKKNNITENLFGVAIEYNLNEFGNIGLLFYQNSFSNSFEHSNLLDPVGNKFNYISSSYNFGYGKINLSGETTFNKNDFATLNTIDLNIDKNFALVFSFRNYGKEFWNVHSNGFGERDFAQNEIGYYSGIKLKTIYGSINFYYDQFKFPYINPKYPFSTKGNDFLIYYTFKPIKNFEFRIRYKNEIKEISQIKNDVYSLSKKQNQNLRSEFLLTPFANLQLRTRLEFTTVFSQNTINEKGYLVFQDVKFQPIKNFNISTRFIFFKTDSYESRIYEFENDLTGVMTNPALYGDGMRWYIVMKYQTNFGFTLSLKYSELYKPNEIFLGSGDSQIIGNLDNRISFQLDYKL